MNKKEIIEKLKEFKTIGVRVEIINAYDEECAGDYGDRKGKVNVFEARYGTVTDPKHITIRIFKNTKETQLVNAIEQTTKALDKIQEHFVVSDIYKDIDNEFNPKRGKEEVEHKDQSKLNRRIVSYSEEKSLYARSKPVKPQYTEQQKNELRKLYMTTPDNIFEGIHGFSKEPENISPIPDYKPYAGYVWEADGMKTFNDAVTKQVLVREQDTGGGIIEQIYKEE